MKNIFLIETFPDGFKRIKSYLSEWGAQCIEFDSVNDAIKTEIDTDLVLLLANKDINQYQRDLISLKNSTLARVPRISFLPLEISEAASTTRAMLNELSFQIPVDKQQLFSTLAKVLKIPERRSFRIIITIQPRGSSLRYTGMSIDFSETGLAFSCRATFEKGQKIVVTFVNPKGRNRIILEGEIVRMKSSLADDESFYGVSFVNMTERVRKDLLRFIKGKR